MGYTHYWSFDLNSIKQNGHRLEKQYQQAVLECQTVCYLYNKQQAKGSHTRLAGAAGHAKPGNYLGLDINGREEYGHENFALGKHLVNNVQSEFCKTAEKPYDAVVVACLIILKYRLGDLMDVSSDGYMYQWVDGLCLVKDFIPDLNILACDIPKTIELKLRVV